jgi:hypothetical protein
MPWRSLPALIGLTRCAARGYPYRNHNVGQDVAWDIDLGLPVVDDITSVGESPAPQQDPKDVKCYANLSIWWYLAQQASSARNHQMIQASSSKPCSSNYPS